MLWPRPTPTRPSDSAIKVNLIDPGATATRMRAEAYPGEDQSHFAHA